jgi:SAM-dependent methyltransferase
MSIYSLLTNNMLLNNILIALGMDGSKELSLGQWKAFTYNPCATEQQNAGFSHKPEVEEALKRVKARLVETLSDHVPHNGSVLDIGCGPGIYLKLLSDRYQVTGIDVSTGMLQAAATAVPGARLFEGNFLSINFPHRFHAIYSISVLEYIPVSRINDFFKKCADLLEPGGVLFIQYPHALSRADLFYPDRNYIQYSPARLSKIASRYLRVLENRQSFDGRETCVYDRNPYPAKGRIFKNGYLLIALKK